MKLNFIELKNFKGVVLQTYNTSNKSVAINGKNGLGKTTILDAYFWLMANCGYDLSSIVVAPIGNELSETEVTANVTINKNDYTLKKVQIRKPKGDGLSTSNTYFVNDVPKTEKAFNEFLSEVGITKDMFLAVSNPNYFFSQKVDSKREILLGMVKGCSEIEIAKKLGMADIVEELSSISLSGIKAKAESRKKAYEKEVGKSFVLVNTKIDVLNEILADFTKAKVSKNVIGYINSRLDSLKELRKEVSQSIADCERLLEHAKAVEQEMIRTSELEINSHFDGINFILWTTTLDGTIKPCCTPVIDHYKVGESTNNARTILAKASAMNGIANYYNYDFPMLIDNAEALDKDSLKKLESNRQLIVSKVTNAGLKIQ